jgi:hypothetical protein
MTTSNNKFYSINWKDAKALVENGTLTIIGGNEPNINNQGEYTLSADGKKLYKRRWSAIKPTYDIIAESK